MKKKETQALRWFTTAQDDFQSLEKDFRELDRYYIPTRYPDGLPGTIPAEAYGSSDAESALNAATRIISFVKERIETL